MTTVNLNIENSIAEISLLSEGKFTSTLLEDINHALDKVEQNNDCSGLILTGSGKNFSQGYDIEFLLSIGEDAKAFTDATMQLLSRLLEFSIPTIAAINGHAFGLGAMVAVACDYRYMRSDRGYFCLPEVDLKMLLLPGMNALLKHKLPEAAYREALLTGKRYTSDEALKIGIVDRVYEGEILVREAKNTLSLLMNKDRNTYSGLKKGLYSEILDAISTYH